MSNAASTDSSLCSMPDSARCATNRTAAPSPASATACPSGTPQLLAAGQHARGGPRQAVRQALARRRSAATSRPRRRVRGRAPSAVVTCESSGGRSTVEPRGAPPAELAERGERARRPGPRPAAGSAGRRRRGALTSWRPPTARPTAPASVQPVAPGACGRAGSGSRSRRANRPLHHDPGADRGDVEPERHPAPQRRIDPRRACRRRWRQQRAGLDRLLHERHEGAVRRHRQAGHQRLVDRRTRHQRPLERQRDEAETRRATPPGRRGRRWRRVRSATRRTPDASGSTTLR